MVLKKIIPVLLILIAIAIGGWFYKAYKTVPALPAYENDLTDEQGHVVKLSDLKGKYVLISYFQTWCGDCIKELPTIDALQMKLGKEKLRVLMVSDESTEKINRFKERCNTLDYYQSNKPLREISIRVFPTTYLLNKDGVIIMSKINGFDWSSDEVVNKCKE
ncbi:MAG: TlpA family protein disulfide reductase [Bacteroidia bacterium]